ncbi:hypothetical protein HNY73_012476 [Argiope bruennichi]|uniref:Mos1 transposase HTH domain-containing protein n=1 Tax=Argiope bruennichi TaxID=94029 RepID=A0A8T0EWN6_ARGBR|nr:hypothetical protein HNY73_012476 [Argiope bruennichi]
MEGVTPAAIYRCTVTIYGEDCVSDKSVRKWSARFCADRESLVDDPGPGQETTHSHHGRQGGRPMRSDRCVTLQMLAVKVDVSVGTAWTIVHDRLRYRKVYAEWVPKQLTDQHKELRMELALQHLFRFKVGNDRHNWVEMGNVRMKNECDKDPLEGYSRLF